MKDSLIQKHIENAVHRDRMSTINQIQILKEPILRKILKQQELTEKENIQLEVFEEIIKVLTVKWWDWER